MDASSSQRSDSGSHQKSSVSKHHQSSRMGVREAPNDLRISQPQLAVNTTHTYPNCICNRKKCAVTCLNLHCDWSGIGRVRLPCTVHPSDIFLLDLAQCPKCQGNLKEVPDRLVPLENNYKELNFS